MISMITTAIQRGNIVYVYGEKNQTIFTASGILMGYTGTTVTVKRGSIISVYNDKGQIISTYGA
jgi:hypothetical protein